VVGKRQVGLEPATPVERHRWPTDDPQAGRIEAQCRADRPGGESAGGDAGIAPGFFDLPQEPGAGLALARRHRVNARAVYSDLQLERLASVEDPPHGDASRRGQGGELDLELLRREDRFRLEPLSSLVGALLRGPQRPVQPVP